MKTKLTKRLVLVVPDWVENDDGPKIRQVLATYAVSSTTHSRTLNQKRS